MKTIGLMTLSISVIAIVIGLLSVLFEMAENYNDKNK